MTDPSSVPAPSAGNVAAASAAIPIAMVVDAAGVWPVAAAADMRERIGTFCWVDVFGGAESERKNLLTELGLEGAEVASAPAVWAGRPDGSLLGRNTCAPRSWLADPGGTLIEIHLLGTQQRIVTVWSGDAAALEEVRQHFAERVGAVARNPYQAASMLLQLLLGTLDHAVRNLDSRLENLRVELDRGEASAIDLTPLAAQRRDLQTAWINFDRYSSAVRAAMVGIEAVAGVDGRRVAETRPLSLNTSSRPKAS
jgi:hypothetical protein